MYIHSHHNLKLTSERASRTDNMKLTEQQQKQIMKNNPNQPFDICSKCEGVQLYGTMKDINEINFDLICNDCINQQASEQKG